MKINMSHVKVITEDLNKEHKKITSYLISASVNEQKFLKYEIPTTNFELQFNFEYLYDKSEYDIINELIDVVRIKIALVYSTISSSSSIELGWIGFNQLDLLTPLDTEEFTKIVTNFIIEQIRLQFFYEWYRINVIEQFSNLYEKELFDGLNLLLNNLGYGLNYTKDLKICNISVFKKDPFEIIVQSNNYLNHLADNDNNYFKGLLLTNVHTTLKYIFNKGELPVNVEVNME